VITGWKEIAAWFGCNVRTVRRYEQDRGLPVHRAPGKKGSTVFAHPTELDAWLESRRRTLRLDPALLTRDMALLGGDVRHSNPRATNAIPLSALSDEHQAKQVSPHRWQPSVVVVFGVLISSALLLWLAENHRTATATTSALGTLQSRPHVPAHGAEDLFHRGRYFWNLRTADSLARAIDAYTQAIVIDPSYAEAYTGLAESYDLLPQFGHADLESSLGKAELAADRAIELNPNLAGAHRAKAFAMFYLDWDIKGSEAEFRHALALDPNSADTHQWYASTLQCRGEGAEAVRQIDEAVHLNPTSAAIAADAAFFHADFGDFEAGVKALKEIEQTQQTLSTPALFLRELDFATGDYPGYIAEASRYAAITHAPDDVELADAIAGGWARNGKIGLLEARAKILEASFERGNETGFFLGETLLLLGQPQKALPYFRASLSRHAILLITMQDCPWAKGLSHDPGYVALFNQVHERLHGGAPGSLSAVPVSRRLPM
jgi:tetratricopeptide (TPR) repeat protein